MGTRDYSSTAASNLSVGGISIAEGWLPASVNNAQRAVLADTAALLLDLGGATETTGSATAYLLALDSAPTAYANNLFFLATSHTTNSGTATINLNGIGVKDIEKIVAGTPEPITAGDFPEGHIGVFTYSSANNSVILVNPATETQVYADGVATLRTRTPYDGRGIMLAYHTTPGDLGGGMFYGVTGDAPGTHVDNDGTIIVPTGGDGSAAWLRVWDGITAHVGWFGATCDGVTDDYDAVKACLELFTNGRSALATGTIDVGPGFAYATPLVYGGNNAHGFKLKGQHSLSRGPADFSTLKYTGPATEAAITLYGGNAILVEDINFTPGNALNGIVCTTDNTFATTLTAARAAGASVVATVATTTELQPGCFLGIDAGGDNFEVVRVIQVNSGTTFTATFTKSHANGAQVGGGASASGWDFKRCRFLCPPSDVWTTIPLATTAGTDVVWTPASMTGITVGMPLRLGSYGNSEIVQVTAVTATTFTATSGNSHLAGARVMYPTAAILFGNRLLETVQVSEISFDNCSLTAAVGFTQCYAGIRQIGGGNVKNFHCYNMDYTYLVVPFAWESSSGAYLISGAVGGGVTDTIILCHAPLIVEALSDESAALILKGGSGTSYTEATFIGCLFGGQAPTTDDEMVVYGGMLTFIGCTISNNRDYWVSLPMIVMNSIKATNFPAALTLLNCQLRNVTASGATSQFVRETQAIYGGGGNVLDDAASNFTMINCTGGNAGSLIRLPTIIEATSRWQNTDTYDPPSLAAGAVGSIQTLSVPGAALGDLVDASFSVSLQGVQINAWVSAADIVSYQFQNTTTGLVDLASGTVKVRARK